MCIGDEDLSCKRINTFITIIWTQSCLLLSDDVCLKEIATTLVKALKAELHLDNFKGDILKIVIFFLHPHIPDFQKAVSRPLILSDPNKPYINEKLIYSAFR